MGVQDQVECHDPKTDMMTLVYSHQDKSASTQRKRKKSGNIKQEQDKGGKLIHSK